MPKWMMYILIIGAVLAMIPPAVIARARSMQKSKPRVHLVQDMDNQAKFRAQHANPLFADGRAMRPIVPGTVARGELNLDDHLHLGMDGNAPATSLPDGLTVDAAFMARGQERFNIFCTPCHGAGGYGDGIVHLRAMELLNTGTNGTAWVPPKSIHEQAIREQPIGQLFNSITNGVRNMAGYESQIPVEDRWAIALYVKALQRSQNARPTDIPASERDGLEHVNLIPEEASQ